MSEADDDHHHLDVIKLLASKVLDATTSSFVIVEDDVRIVKHEAAKVVAEVIKAGSRPSSAQSRGSRPVSASARPSAAMQSQKSIGEQAHLTASNSVNSIITGVVSRPVSASLLKANSTLAPVEEAAATIVQSSSKSTGIAGVEKNLIQTAASQAVSEIITTASRPSSAAKSTKSPNIVASNTSIKQASPSVSTKSIQNEAHLLAQTSVKDIISGASSRPSSASIATPSVKTSTAATVASAEGSVKNERSKTPTELVAASLASSAVNGIITVATSRPSSALVGNSSVKSTATSERPPLNPKSGNVSPVPVVIATTPPGAVVVAPQRSEPSARPSSAPSADVIHSLASTSVTSFLSTGTSSAAATAAARRPVSAAPTTAPAPAAPRSPQGKDLVQGVQRAAQSTAVEAIGKATISTSRPSSAASSPVKAAVVASLPTINSSGESVSSKPTTPLNAATTTTSGDIMVAHLAAVTLVKDIIVRSQSNASIIRAASFKSSGGSPTAAGSVASHVRFNEVATVLPVVERKASVDVAPESNGGKETLKMFEKFSSHHPGSEIISGVSVDFVSAAVRRGSQSYHEKHLKSGSSKKGVNFAVNDTLMEVNAEGDVLALLPAETLAELRDSDSLSESNSGKVSTSGLTAARDDALLRSMSGLTENTLDYIETASSNSIEMFNKFSAHHPDVATTAVPTAITTSEGVRFSPAQMVTKQNTVNNTHIEATNDDLDLQIYEDLSETPVVHSKHLDGTAGGAGVKPRTAPAALGGTNVVKFSPFATTTITPPVVPVMQLPSVNTSTNSAGIASGAADATVKPSPRVTGPTLEHISPRPITSGLNSSSNKIAVPSAALSSGASPAAASSSNNNSSSDNVFNTMNNGGLTSTSPAPSPSDSMLSDVHRFGRTSRPTSATSATASSAAVVPGPKVDALLDSLVKGSPRLTSQQAVTALMKISPRLVSPRVNPATVAAATASSAKSSSSTNGIVAVATPLRNENVNSANNMTSSSNNNTASTSKPAVYEEIDRMRKKAEQERADQLRELQVRHKTFAEQESRILEAKKTKIDMEKLLNQLQRDLVVMDEKREAKNNSLLQALNLLQSQMQENNQLLMHNRKK